MEPMEEHSLGFKDEALVRLDRIEAAIEEIRVAVAGAAASS